ncbi:von Willebrand factor type A domain protein [Streptococcus sanguinis]|uniref:von Willebrand factor type A domain protein n=2 Tax=Streptococcus sanguinis TaxID=1305 RepID=A0AB74DKS5_STRSA|nr:von Willebrand factor type A domain protein [Streptococcus sanguinis]RSI33376.1 von Willebrand factor type A domain protein [Streptococcus sanguinis]
MKQIQKGFTLVEMIMAIMLMSLIALIIGVIFNTMFSSRELIEREASIQAEMRTSMQYVDRTVGKATSIFILDDSKFKGSKQGLTREWSYIGLSADGKKVMNYVWNKQKQDWDISELGTKSLYNMKLDLEFKTEGAYQDNRLISYNLSGKYPDTNNKLSIDTAISALNTKQVFSKVAKGKKGIAIAYRTDPIQGQMNIAVSFVFDTSGSMKWDLQGGRVERTGKESRINILRKKSEIMIKDLAEIGNISVNLVGFSNSGKYIQQNFSNLDNGTKSIIEAINDEKKVSPNGVTNPGDGLRYGMVSLQSQPAQLKYIVLLTDGIPNAYLVDPSALYAGNRVDHGQVVGRVSFNNPIYDLSPTLGYEYIRLGYDLDSKDFTSRENSIAYAGEVSKKFGLGVKRVNVIGFSGVNHEIAYGQSLTDRIGEGGMETKYVSATNEEALQKTFSDIKKQIQQDLWFVSGP